MQEIVFLKFGFYGSNLVIFTKKVAKHLLKIKSGGLVVQI